MAEEQIPESDAADLPTPSLIDRIRENLIYVAWAQAVFATLVSLFLSEVMGFLPCDLCWYQRILMYPIVIVQTVGILTADPRIRNYVLPFAFLGIGLSFYHNLLYYEFIPKGFSICSSGIPCEARWIEWLGFAGIPFASFTAFVVIALAMLWYKLPVDADDEDDAPQAQVTSSGNSDKIRNGLSLLVIAVFLFTTVIAVSSRVAENRLRVEQQQSSSTTPTPIVAQGRQIYATSCAACHGQNGEGVANLGLPLANTTFMQENSDADLLEFILTGRLPNDGQSQTGIAMPEKGGNLNLTDAEIMAGNEILRALK